MSNSAPRPIRYVVFHKPGPKWGHGVDFREQDGVGEHVQHYLKLHKQGKLALGGPFLLQDAVCYNHQKMFGQPAVSLQHHLGCPFGEFLIPANFPFVVALGR